LLQTALIHAKIDEEKGLVEAIEMDFNKILKNVDIFEGLSDHELTEVAKICKERQYYRGQTIAQEGDQGNEFFIISSGFVDILIGGMQPESARVVVSLGSGQVIGEMALLDQGPRSASIIASSNPTTVQAIKRKDFEHLCQEHTNIGYIVMHNLAADLSFKLRHRNLNDRQAGS
jgi:CRP/FNR family cyclic AMP-dependent transcriptional regulator